MLALTTEYKDEAKKNQSRPVELYDVYFGDQETADADTLYFTSNNCKLAFWNLNGEVKIYTPLRYVRGSIPLSSKLEIETIPVEFDNADNAWGSWLTQKDRRGSRVVLRKIFLDLLTDPTHAKICFDGIINAVMELTHDPKIVKLEFRSNLMSLAVETGAMQGLYCENIFGDDFCTFNIDSTKVTGQTVDAGSTKTLIIDAARSEDAGYWKPGIIRFTSGQNAGEERSVVEYDNVAHELTLEYSLPHTPQEGDTYELEQDCDLSLSMCKDKFSNAAHFNGCPHLPALINPRIVTDK